ncbi:MAG TPA: glycosyltransferase [Candidatus Limnocylindrales bacterium]|nr:glycosyltransferase [Candidatus Limnocylindrales bacterium]
MTEATRLGASIDARAGGPEGGPPGVRVVLDARPLQEPERAPLTAAYLDGLLGAYDANPLPGESFALLLRSDLDDPTTRFSRLDVVGRRLLPPTHLLRSAALTVDPVVLSGASLGAAWRSEAGGAAGSVYHALSGAIPLAIRVPVVVTLLDLAPWELPRSYQRTVAGRIGQRLRGRLLRDAAAVIVGSEAVATAARRVLRIRRDRLRIVPLAPRPAYAFWPDGSGAARASVKASRSERERLGLPERYLVYSGRYDARQDLATLLRALSLLAAAGRPDGLPEDVPWPPRVLLIGASPEDRASLARAAARVDVGESLAYAPRLSDERAATLVRGARAAILPALSDATGLPALEAVACGTPVIASAVGALPDAVGTAGILVAPREPERLAAALATAWADDRVHARLAASAREAAEASPRTWADVAAETRQVYAEVGIRPSSG